MKLNHECVRDLLLAVETHCTKDNLFHEAIIELPELKKYDLDTIIYTAQKLNEAGFLNGSFEFFMDGEIYITISSLSYNGHSFLDAIRDETIWNETKNAASKVASVSLPVLFDLGTTYLKAKLGLS